ncbi:GNAT family N-acetyltransferase [Kribbella sp. NPDC051587]|uniref:GNAT family N-acetyltransferase n=1 Tax=Kribbella sp. NPDC051587 TaxID=3364119 RepID=UPI00378FDA82
MLHAAADRNVAAALRHFGAQAAISQTRELLLVAAAAPWIGAFHNAAIRLDPGADASAVVQDVLSFSTRRSRDLVLWASTRRDEDLIRVAVASGMSLRSTAVGMAAYEAPRPLAVPAGVELERVVDPVGAAEFAAVHESFIGDAAAVAHFASPAVLLTPAVSAFVVRSGDRPVACAMTVRSGSEAGVYWVATRADERRRGYGELATRAAVRAGFEGGTRVVLLQSTELGLPLYSKLGFAPFTTYARYLTPSLGVEEALG